jgi:hypothetical protein
LEDIVPVIAIEQKWLNNNGPWYSLSIDREGTVEYNGINKVKTLGKQLSNIKKEELNELVDVAISIYFFSLRDEYGDIINYPNSCQTSISISLEKRYKKITYLNESRVPRDLVWLVKKIERITNVAQWIGSV